jgi:hypothetical protein
MKFRLVMAFGAISHRKLNGEIDAKADKQDRKSHRYHVQRADHHQAERGSHRKSHK